MGDVAVVEGSSVQNEMKKLVTQALQSRGYNIADTEDSASKIITIDINKFWAWFSPGMWSVSFECQLDCQISFKSQTGVEKVNVNGYGKNNGQVASNANWALAFKRAFLDFLKNFDAEMDKKSL